MIIPFPGKTDSTKHNHEAMIKQRKIIRTEGGHALQRLEGRRKRLSKEDAAKIANRIDTLITTNSIKPGDLAEAAGLVNGTKELHRLRLPEGIDPEQRRLHTTPGKYLSVILGLQKLTSQEINRLADQILIGTELHPRASKASGVDQLSAVLQEIVLQLDKKFHLHELYVKSGELRVNNLGDWEPICWPFFDVERSAEYYEKLKLSDLELTKKQLKSMGLEDARLDKKIDDIDISIFDDVTRENIDTLMSIKKTFFEHDEKYLKEIETYWGTNCLADEGAYISLDFETAILNLPHIYLGPLIKWGEHFGLDPNDFSNRAQIESIRSNYCVDGTPAVIKDEISGEIRLENIQYEIFTAWLIIYPNHAENGLSPTLYIFDPEYESEIIPINVPNLIRMDEWEIIINDSHCSVVERIKDLLGYGDKENLVLSEWARTAPFLSLNPLLQRESKRKNQEYEFKSKLNDIWEGE